MASLDPLVEIQQILLKHCQPARENLAEQATARPLARQCAGNRPGLLNGLAEVEPGRECGARMGVIPLAPMAVRDRSLRTDIAVTEASRRVHQLAQRQGYPADPLRIPGTIKQDDIGAL